MGDLPIIPGRGIGTPTAIKLRLEYLDSLSIDVDKVSSTSLDPEEINNNIESFIGSVEVPLGIVGPLKFIDDGKSELVYTAAGTLEGALISSMNRGARVLSKSEGVKADVEWQRMTRSPLFVFDTENYAKVFEEFVFANLDEFKSVAESYSNHAKVTDVKCQRIKKDVHLKIYYNTGDASGQNMTTTCTWHAILNLADKFSDLYPDIHFEYVIEGNGASDKKVSIDNIDNGRGIRVSAYCDIPEKIIHEVLRTTSDKFIKFFEPSKDIAKFNGMVGYNVNVANAIAAIFVATGQDLASIHESGLGFLEISKSDKGLAVKLTLTNLVIGTVGGGTHLPKQQEVLGMMQCSGSGKVERFAKLIASFALGLEVSTFAAIVSGQFAKSHEKLGRNRPVNWLVKSEIKAPFVKRCLKSKFPNISIKSMSLVQREDLDSGILTNITSRVSNKLIGFIPLKLSFDEGLGKIESSDIVVKSKALDRDTIKGLHTIASFIDIELADLISLSGMKLEYRNNHLKELKVNEYLDQIEYAYFPKFFGTFINESREIYLLFQELVDSNTLIVHNSENNPEVWNEGYIFSVIDAIDEFHQKVDPKSLTCVQEFYPWESISLYQKLLSIILDEDKEGSMPDIIMNLLGSLDNLEEESMEISISKTVIHNDCNPRNIMIRKNGNPVFYDWELAVVDYPHRDILEFLSFVLLPDFKEEELKYYLEYHLKKYESVEWEEWLKACKYSIKVYLISRISFYEVSAILAQYDFSSRVYKTSLRMYSFISKWE